MNGTAISHEHVQGSFELHVVSTGAGDQATFVKVAKDVWPWVDYIHIREKQLTWQEKVDWAESLRGVGVPFCRIVINGSELNSQNENYGGVHWGQEAIRNYNNDVLSNVQRLRLGVSVHSMDEAKIAEEQGADYLFFGHVYSTNSKPDLEPRGLNALAEVCRCVSIPVIAIGGIEPGNIHAIRSAGARGVAVISNVWASDSPDRAAASLRQAIVGTESLSR
ncbi:thiamine phosphate synthase [Paenibacillus amylolyticus]|uniref:Transcriptional regulator, TenI n=1 Tax=Paenibacillus amylolyticus TaxID=1451 RepID=A0A100VM89_PAEAM|nr:thiamine phosphate synthase [Paenibacillus amylolyticus]GAS82326.1 transcriptional regulator, TenI [Paenibacillus amylolyticus]